MFSQFVTFVAEFPSRPDAPFWWLVVVGLLAGSGIVLVQSEMKSDTEE